MKKGDLRKIFISTIQKFIKENFWVFVVFFVCVGIIWRTNTGSLGEIIIVFVVQFLAQIFFMLL